MCSPFHVRKLLFLFLFITIGKFSHSALFLTAEERAYLFHVVKESPTLDRNIGQYFHYSGDTIYDRKYKQQWDYDTLETLIIQNPEWLDIDIDQLKNASPGILAETASKLVLWRTQRILEKDDSRRDSLVHKLFSSIQQALPDNAFRRRNRELGIQEPVMDLYQPNLSFFEKRDLLNKLKWVTLNEKKEVVYWIDKSYIQYFNSETENIYLQLGGRREQFFNITMAAGEGSGSNGLLNEVDETNEKLPYQSAGKGLGLFSYQYTTGKNDLGKWEVQTKKNPIQMVQGYNQPQNTKIHLSMWGFNAFFQSTVVLKTGNRSYLLFASQQSTELTPDSTHEHGKTYFRHLKEIEYVIIPGLVEEVDGPEGLKAMKENYYQNRLSARERMDQAQYDLRELEMQNKQRTKKYSQAQERYINFTNAYQRFKNLVYNAESMIYKKEREIDSLYDVLYAMKSDLGTYTFPIEEDGYIYTWEDGSYFNSYTQDFYFSDLDNATFSIRVLAIGSKPFSKNVDEVQLNVSVIQEKEKKHLHFDLPLVDFFDPDQFKVSKLNFGDTANQLLDTMALYILQEGLTGTSTLKGLGVLKLNPEDPFPKEIATYPGRNESQQAKSRESFEFKSRRKSEISWHYDGAPRIEVSSGTDPVISMIGKDSTVNAFMYKKEIRTGNELLSALRTWALFEYLVKDMEKRITRLGNDLEKMRIAHEKLDNLLNQSVVETAHCEIRYTEYLYLKGLLE